MELNSLLDDLVNSIATASALKSWCNSTYGQDHKVFVNIDKRNSPGVDDCPFVIIFPVQKSVGRGVSNKQHGFEIDCCIYNDTLETPAEPNIIEYKGVKEIETFRKKVETAIGGCPPTTR